MIIHPRLIFLISRKLITFVRKIFNSQDYFNRQTIFQNLLRTPKTKFFENSTTLSRKWFILIFI